MDAIEARLRRERTTASRVELDELKLRAMRQAAQTKGIRGNLMKSRFALLAMIVAGFMMSTTGATLAVSGSSGSGSAATNEYYTTPPGDQNGTSGGQTLAGQEEGGPEVSQPGGAGGGGEQPAAAQEAAQEEAAAGGESLPFTGFLAIPLLIGGVALMGTGAALHRRAGRS
ncbi:MAG TPA: hypothetical protein VHG69_09970 [Thermoleophilaceae bacterium]|nr:hypothetical protein [Thermoleophilaceae bacterium]